MEEEGGAGCGGLEEGGVGGGAGGGSRAVLNLKRHSAETRQEETVTADEQ